jgi:hypothetical protein
MYNAMYLYIILLLLTAIGFLPGGKRKGINARESSAEGTNVPRDKQDFFCKLLKY